MNSYQPEPQPDPSITPPQSGSDADMAVGVIRDKLSRLYAAEPDARGELAEAEHVRHRSKHQQFMHELSTSGKDLATIQTEWHNYYQNLPDNEKHQVWHEFYSSQSAITGLSATTAPQTPVVTQHVVSEQAHQAISTNKRTKEKAVKQKRAKMRDARSKEQIREAIKDKVSAGGKLEAKHHLQSLLFGLGVGAVVLVIFLFGFFNEVVLAPFIQPSRVTAATPLIVSDNTIAASDQPEVIIPKINVQIPVDYNQTTTDESVIENALDSAVVHYPTTVKPGELGNTAFFGHSSNNIFNKGKYKFAFVLLHTLVPGDTFYLTYNKKVYVYKVIDRKVVDPSEVGVLGPVPGQQATATLITCDPPGTSLKRLIVVGQQISPDPAGNTQGTTPVAASSTGISANLPGNGPTLLGKVTRSPAGKIAIFMIVLGVGLIAIRRLKALSPSY